MRPSWDLFWNWRLVAYRTQLTAFSSNIQRDAECRDKCCVLYIHEVYFGLLRSLASHTVEKAFGFSSYPSFRQVFCSARCLASHTQSARAHSNWLTQKKSGQKKRRTRRSIRAHGTHFCVWKTFFPSSFASVDSIFASELHAVNKSVPNRGEEKKSPEAAFFPL